MKEFAHLYIDFGDLKPCGLRIKSITPVTPYNKYDDGQWLDIAWNNGWWPIRFWASAKDPGTAGSKQIAWFAPLQNKEVIGQSMVELTKMGFNGRKLVEFEWSDGTKYSIAAEHLQKLLGGQIDYYHQLFDNKKNRLVIRDHLDPVEVDLGDLKGMGTLMSVRWDLRYGHAAFTINGIVRNPSISKDR